MASNGLCDGSTGGGELVLLVDRRRLIRSGRPFIDREGLLRLSTEPDGILADWRENGPGESAEVSFVASSYQKMSAPSEP